jgi:protease-4
MTMNDFETPIPPVPSQAVSPQPIHIHMPGQKPSIIGRITRIIWLVLTCLFVLAILGAIISAVEELEHAMADGTEWTVVKEGDIEQCVAIYNLTGPIHAGSASAFEEFVRDTANDDQIKAFVIRVNSPGGTVSASNRLNQCVEELKATGKPVVISMGSVAASGGYMASCNGTEIFAEPSTITGSIGVIAQWMVIEGTLDKIGVEPMTIKSTDADYWKDDISAYHKPDARQMADLRKMLNAMQEQFNDSVRKGRGSRLKPRETKLKELTIQGPADEAVTLVMVDIPALTETEPFNGKVYIAAEALELGMIDRIGYRKDAEARAAELAGLDNPHVIVYTKRGGLMLGLQLLSTESESPTETIENAIDTVSTPKIMAIWQMD